MRDGGLENGFFDGLVDGLMGFGGGEGGGGMESPVYFYPVLDLGGKGGLD